MKNPSQKRILKAIKKADAYKNSEYEPLSSLICEYWERQGMEGHRAVERSPLKTVKNFSSLLFYSSSEKRVEMTKRYFHLLNRRRKFISKIQSIQVAAGITGLIDIVLEINDWHFTYPEKHSRLALTSADHDTLARFKKKVIAAYLDYCRRNNLTMWLETSVEFGELMPVNYTEVEFFLSQLSSEFNTDYRWATISPPDQDYNYIGLVLGAGCMVDITDPILYVYGTENGEEPIR